MTAAALYIYDGDDGDDGDGDDGDGNSGGEGDACNDDGANDVAVRQRQRNKNLQE